MTPGAQPTAPPAVEALEGGAALGWAAVRYLVIGAVLNLGSIALFGVIWLSGIGLAPVGANLASSSLLFPLWFALNRKWVFRSESPVGPQARRAVVAYGTAMAASACLMWTLSGLFGIPAIPAQVLTIGTLVVASFIANAFWTFAPRGAGWQS